LFRILISLNLFIYYIFVILEKPLHMSYKWCNVNYSSCNNK